MRPVNHANDADPMIMMTIANALSEDCFAVMSPYPMVVMVVMAQ